MRLIAAILSLSLFMGAAHARCVYRAPELCATDQADMPGASTVALGVGLAMALLTLGAILSRNKAPDSEPATIRPTATRKTVGIEVSW